MNRSGQIAHLMPIGADRKCKTSEVHPIFRAHTFCLVLKEKTLDLQIFNQIEKMFSSSIYLTAIYLQCFLYLDLTIVLLKTANNAN